jgi:hypothetical protein
MSDTADLKWPVFRRSGVAAFQRSLTRVRPILRGHTGALLRQVVTELDGFHNLFKFISRPGL